MSFKYWLWNAFPCQTPVLDRSVWDASCVAFDKALDRLTLSPMGIENTAASIRQLRITGCISPSEQEPVEY